MKHTLIVGKPVERGGKVVDYVECEEIANNEYFRALRKGFVKVPDDFIAGKNGAAAAGPESDDDDLSKKTVPMLKEIATDLDINVSGMKKADLIAAIESAQSETE